MAGVSDEKSFAETSTAMQMYEKQRSLIDKIYSVHDEINYIGRLIGFTKDQKAEREYAVYQYFKGILRLFKFEIRVLDVSEELKVKFYGKIYEEIFLMRGIILEKIAVEYSEAYGNFERFFDEVKARYSDLIDLSVRLDRGEDVCLPQKYTLKMPLPIPVNLSKFNRNNEDYERDVASIYKIGFDFIESLKPQESPKTPAPQESVLSVVRMGSMLTQTDYPVPSIPWKRLRVSLNATKKKSKSTQKLSPLVIGLYMSLVTKCLELYPPKMTTSIPESTKSTQTDPTASFPPLTHIEYPPKMTTSIPESTKSTQIDSMLSLPPVSDRDALLVNVESLDPLSASPIIPMPPRLPATSILSGAGEFCHHSDTESLPHFFIEKILNGKPTGKFVVNFRSFLE
ncbi:MAG: hypothetical protein LBJ09_03390 [Clostridiales bacterium]|jgi:hypothetical protein|nr:hypothetical protein [Clostridiales bacterium]